ncbi:Uncharacterised protein (plasmid) [Mesomycoplasma hyorhinis]|nr:hypothetical protein Q453_0408 [Mesomycoplasma hyorhinis DBS 1050]QEA01606.1 hypothetical protein EIH16_01490 [Mesomycoplasma hyorhinis]VEU57899.1 Uncharacterised protein [Mesomycoplasma hyorhinis]
MHKKYQFLKTDDKLKLENQSKTDNALVNLEKEMSELSTIERILKLLDPHHVIILQKEFLETDKNWKDNYWSKTTYYKKVHQAIDQFLYFLYG